MKISLVAALVFSSFAIARAQSRASRTSLFPSATSSIPPTKPVRWGSQTWEEMMIGLFDYTLEKENLQASVGQ